MHEDYNAFLIGLFFLLLIGSWIVANALIDLAAKRVRIWVASRWDGLERRRSAATETDGPRTIS